MTEENDERPSVIVGFDGSECSRRALEWAADECMLRRSGLVVLHVDQWNATALELAAFENEAAIEEGVLEEGVRLAEERHPDLRVSGRRMPPPAGASLVASTTTASLLVVGSRGLGHLQHMVLGSVSRYCVEHAHCPVVVVRGL